MKKILLCLVFLTLASTAISQNVEISDRLEQRMRSLNPLEYTKVIVMLSDQVDMLALDAYLYQINASPELRAKTVITSLMQKAQSTQGPLLEYLNTQRSIGKVREIIPFWITNTIVIEATPDVITQVSKRLDVGIMDIDAELDYDRPTSITTATESSSSSENGLKVINAHLLWNMGITGNGRLVMSDDTGVLGTHPALNHKWRGNTVPWYHAWIDPSGGTTSPNDCDGHGTHTVGTMCGRAGSDTIGVAPDAQWIAAKTICGGSGTSNHMIAWQWALNPDSNVNTINDMPDAIGNSWHDPTITNQCVNVYVGMLNSMEAAGVAIVFSAGNSGPGASTITRPKNVNTNPVNSFAVGNINGNTSFPWPINAGSSRGPSLCGGTGTLLIKPEVVAPGTSVRSSYGNGGYANLTGTSMACPHVVGSVALLKSAFPNKTGKEILEALHSTARDLGTAGEDNTYGNGVIDVKAAYDFLSSSSGSNENYAMTLPTPGVNTNYVAIPHQSSMVGFGNNITIEGWMKIGTTTNANTLLNKGATSFDYQLGVNAGGNPFFRGQGTIVIANTYIMPVNVWKHLAATYDGTTVRFYVDGVEIFSQASAITLGSSTNEMRIGRGGSDPGSGAIDEVRLWSVARTQSEINSSKCLKYPSQFGSTAGLKALWHFDSTFVDSVSGYNGTPMTASVGFDTATLPCVITNISGNNNILPEEFSLMQNYPNPFNPTTKIRFDIPKQSFVTLKVYDVAGREVESLISRQLNAGTYIADFTAKNLSSGVYFYSLQAGDFVQVKKMVLLK
ncbi:MAG TPA: S8 family serine peptidase [Ignavibacteria bacterium]|nr:S8 family serine peptidase [Ignavibacteria bacterium]